MTQIVPFHAEDPRKALLKAVGDISGIEVFNNHVLVAIYVGTKKTKGGIILTDTTHSENQYQSKVGLILAKGPVAGDPDDNWFKGTTLNVGDWIVLRASDGWDMTINGVVCRMLTDISVKARVDHPDRVW